MKYAQKLTAASMAVWLTGIVFLITCHASTATMVDSCPLMRMGAHCDKTDKEIQAERVEKQPTDQGIDCCAFLPQFFDKTRTVDAAQQVITPTPVEVVAPRALIERTNFAPIATHLSPALTRNNTFLITQNFRI